MNIITAFDFIIFPVIIILSMMTFFRQKHPKGLYTLFFTEMWERFGFYTMLAILALYMDEFFKMPKETSGQIYGLFVAFVYFTPLIGGWIADKFWGFVKTIAIGAVIMAAGYSLLYFPDQKIFFIALGLIVIGNGLFKPNISTLVGNLYDKNDPKKDSGFNIFYMGINIGAFYAPSAASFLRTAFEKVPGTGDGWGFAFLAAAVGMLISLAILLIYKNKFKNADSLHKEAAHEKATVDPKEEKNRLIALFSIFGVVILFWMAFHQNGFALTFWARDCTITNLNPELFQKVNPFFVVLFTPLLIWVWTMLAVRKKEPTTPAKIGIGMILTALAFGVMWVGALKLETLGFGGKVGVSWLISSYAVVTLGELCLSPMGLAFVSKVAPARMRGLLMGGWFASTAIGNYASGFLGSYWDKMTHANFFLLLVCTSLFAAVILFSILKTLNRAIAPKEHIHIPGDATEHDVVPSPEPPEEDEEMFKPH
ncbi:MAG: peptide MFS transporter [Armatimonadota bacterium]